MEKNLKITIKKQMEKLVKLMTANPEIGRGKLPFGASKTQHKERWENFSLELNSLGPPIRVAKEWQRVWTHYKANLKRKLAANKKNYQATGGGPSTEVSLTSLEQSTVELVSMQSQVNPSGSAIGLQIQDDSDEVQSSYDIERPSTSNNKQQLPKSQKNRIEDDRIQILKRQEKNQNEILNTLKRLEKTSYKNYEINKKMFEIKRKKAELQNEVLKAKLLLTKKKLEI